MKVNKVVVGFASAIAAPLLVWSITLAGPSRSPELSAVRLGGPTVAPAEGFRDSVGELVFAPWKNRIRFEGTFETNYATAYRFRATLEVYPTIGTDPTTGGPIRAERPAIVVELPQTDVEALGGGCFVASASFPLPPGTYDGEFITFAARDGSAVFQPVSSRRSEFSVE